MKEGLILFDAVQAASCAGIAFDAWHGNHHLQALRAALPGAPHERYASAARACMVTVCELLAQDDAATAMSAHGPKNELAMRVERFLAEPIGTQARPDAGELRRAPVAYPVFFGVPPARQDEFNRWYDEEHLPILLGCPAWLGCRRFRLVTPHSQGYTHMALHYLADTSPLESPERDRARRTPWRDRLAAEHWFRGDYQVFYRLG